MQRAKKANQLLDYTPDELRIHINSALMMPCRYCGCEMTDTGTRTKWTADHATPTSRGGSYCLWNIEIICKGCNECKGALTAEEFAALMYLMREWDTKARTNVLTRLKAGGRAFSLRFS